MDLEFGTPKSLDDITVADVLAHPIWLWVWETGHEGDPGIDETWQQPVVNTTDVSSDMTEPVITFRVVGSNVVGSGSYSPVEDRVSAMAVWSNDKWVLLKDSSLPTPFTLEAVPTINGTAAARFVCSDLKLDKAERIR